MMETETDEKRKVLRRRMLRSGRIVFNGRKSVIDCTVRNLSTEGARLMVASQIGIPSEFELIVGDATRQKQYAQVIWRNSDAIGIEFV